MENTQKDNISTLKDTTKKDEEDTKNHWEGIFGKEGGYEKEPEPKLVAFEEKFKNEIGPKVLDVASGIGRHLVYMAGKGYKMTGLELTENGIKVANDKLKEKGLEAELVNGSFREMPFEKESFDTIYSTNAINRNDWQGAKKTFSNISRVLKDGGIFFLMVRSSSKPAESGRPNEKITIVNEPIDNDLPIEDKGVTFIKERTNEDGTTTKELIHAYSLEELTKLGNKYGLEIIEEPIDEARDGGKGHWNIVYRKHKNS